MRRRQARKKQERRQRWERARLLAAETSRILRTEFGAPDVSLFQRPGPAGVMPGPEIRLLVPPSV
ncbi:MAG: hypothetical protein N3B68_02440 [Anaerolineae bacterium]|nr:hypothetical protein [Anaerolineae bacterium]